MKSSLQDLEAKFQILARQLNGAITRNESKGWTGNRFENIGVRWTRNDMQYLIQIFPEIKNESIKKWIMWACSYKDVSGQRFWERKELMKTKKKDKIIESFDSLFDAGLKWLNNLKPEDLKKANP